jgi:predicted AAA+ superfamily ATPase
LIVKKIKENMKFLPRHLSTRIQSAAKHFKVILLLGARQTGKSTLLSHLLPEVKTILFDPIQDLYDARKDPDQFLNLFTPPLVLDEVQFVPELLASLKRKVDETDRMGQYYLTGSQNFSVLKSIAESMAGRVAIFHLDPLTPLEIVGMGDRKGWLDDYLLNPEEFIRSERPSIPRLPPLHEFIFRGTYPRAAAMPLSELETFFLSYIQTYVERDIRLVENIENLTLFGDFLRLSAVSTAQEINASHLGRELGRSSQTARKWLNLLLHTYQWIENAPYHGNATKRLSDKRKGYFKDTGLACHLMRIHSPEALVTSMKMGALFETWVVNYIQEQFAFTARANCYHWRSHGGAELDLILERDGAFFPIEIKSKSRPTKADASSIRSFRETYPKEKIMPGLVIHAGEETYPLDRETCALSWKAL